MPQGPRNWPPQGSNDDSDNWDVSSESYAELKKKLRDNIDILEEQARRGSASKETDLLAAEAKLREVEKHEQAALREGDRLNALLDRSMDRKNRAESERTALRENEFLAYKKSMAEAAGEDPSRRRRVQKEIEEVRAQIAAKSEASRTERVSVEEETRLQTRLRNLEKELMMGRPDQYSSSSVLHYFGDNIKSLDKALESNPELRKQKLTIAKNYMTRAVDLAARMSKVETADEFHRIKREMDEIRDGFNRLIPPMVMEDVKNPEKRRYTPTQNIILGESAPVQAPAQPEAPRTPEPAPVPQQPEQAPPQPAPQPASEPAPPATPSPQTAERYTAPAYALKPNQRPDEFYGTPNVSVNWEARPTQASQEAPLEAPAPTQEAASSAPAERAPGITPEGVLNPEALLAETPPEKLDPVLTQFYDDWMERCVIGNVFFNADKRALWQARGEASALAGKLATAPAEEREALRASLLSALGSMNAIATRLQEAIGENAIKVERASATAPSAAEEANAGSGKTARRLGWTGALAAIAALGGSQLNDRAPAPPAPTSAASPGTPDRAPGTTASPERQRNAIAGAEFTSARLQRGEGADVLFYDLVRSLRQHYGANVSAAPPSVQYILSQNPHMLGQALGFSGFVKNGAQSVPGSRVMRVGDRLSVDDHGRLSFFDARTGRSTDLMDTLDNKPRVLTVMSDPLRPDTAPRVNVSFSRQPAAPAEQAVRQPITPQPPQQPTAPQAIAAPEAPQETVTPAPVVPQTPPPPPTSVQAAEQPARTTAEAAAPEQANQEQENQEQTEEVVEAPPPPPASPRRVETPAPVATPERPEDISVNPNGVRINMRETHLYAVPDRNEPGGNAIIAYGPRDANYFANVQRLAAENPNVRIYFQSVAPIEQGGQSIPWVSWGIWTAGQGFATPAEPDPSRRDLYNRQLNPSVFRSLVR